VLGFPAGALAGHLDFVLALGALIAGALAGREAAQVAVMVVVERSGSRGSSGNEEGSGSNKRKEGGFHGKWALKEEKRKKERATRLTS
jgi:hypothetical protein